jgi:uncharacterized protein (DUF302 family)
MSYHISRTIEATFEAAVARVKDALAKEGFGVLTEIDVRETLKKKLGVDFRNYKILGACNPQYAHKALEMEDKIGTMLPCNVVVQEKAPGKIEISAANPTESMKAIGNPALAAVAAEVTKKLERVIDGA